MTLTTAMWTLSTVKPLAFGGWTYSLLSDDGNAKNVTWFPGDSTLNHAGRPIPAATVWPKTAKQARASAESLCISLSEPW